MRTEKPLFVNVESVKRTSLLTRVIAQNPAPLSFIEQTFVRSKVNAQINSIGRDMYITELAVWYCYQGHSHVGWWYLCLPVVKT